MSTVPFAERFFCTIEQACQATGLGRTKLYEMMDAGRVQTIHVDKRRLVLVASLLKLGDPCLEPPDRGPKGGAKLDRADAVSPVLGHGTDMRNPGCWADPGFRETSSQRPAR